MCTRAIGASEVHVNTSTQLLICWVRPASGEGPQEDSGLPAMALISQPAAERRLYDRYAPQSRPQSNPALRCSLQPNAPPASRWGSSQSENRYIWGHRPCIRSAAGARITMHRCQDWLAAAAACVGAPVPPAASCPTSLAHIVYGYSFPYPRVMALLYAAQAGEAASSEAAPEQQLCLPQCWQLLSRRSCYAASSTPAAATAA